MGVLLLCVYIYAIAIIIDSFKEWSRKPIETRIETTTAPNKDIDFPALSVCHEMPHSHDSWELPTMIFNALDWINCGAGCKKNLVKQKLSGFKNFFGKLIDKHLASEDPTNSWTTDENGDKKPVIGGFWLPTGYKGMDSMMMMTFRGYYCELGRKLQEGAYMWELENLIQRWKSSFYSLKLFNVDTLMEEYQVYIDFESFTFWDMLDTCDDVNDDVMRFLSKLFTFHSNIILENFGTSFRLFVDYGSLEIMPWSGAPIKTSDDGWVS